MNELAKYLKTPPEGQPTNGASGIESEWLEFGALELLGSHILLCDLGFVPSFDDGLLVPLVPGCYRLMARVINYPGDQRISRLRVVLSGHLPTLAEKLGEAWTDTARTAVCDSITCAKAWDRLGEQVATERLEKAQEEEGLFGVFDLDAQTGANVPFVDSGFGDGCFPVFALTDAGQRIGLEVEFIRPDATYPFGERRPKLETSALEKKQESVESVKIILDVMKQATAKRTGDKEKDRAIISSAFDQFSSGLRAKAVAAIDEFHQHIIKVRKSAPAMDIKYLPCSDEEWMLCPEAQQRVAALNNAGFTRVGIFRVDPLPKFLACGFVHLANGITAEIVQSGAQIGISLGSNYADGVHFSVTDRSSKPGYPCPEWRIVHCLPDINAPDLISRFYCLRPTLIPKPVTIENYASASEESFRRIQAWRADRGGWTISEIKKLRGLSESSETTEELIMARHNSAEAWLFNWLKLHGNLSFQPLVEMERLTIIHDDLNQDQVCNEWWVATRDIKARNHLFADDSPRDAFRRVNQERGEPLLLVLKKVSGLKADYYLPFNTVLET